MKNFLSTLKYNNLVPIFLGVVFLGGGAALAAPQVAKVLTENGEVSTELIRSTNLQHFDLAPTVTSVSESEIEHIITYTMETLAPTGGEWQVITKQGEFTISKIGISPSQLNEYVVRTLKELEEQERTYLASVQNIEREIYANQKTSLGGLLASLIGAKADDIKITKPEEREVVEGDRPDIVSPLPIIDDSNVASSTTSVVSGDSNVATTTDNLAGATSTDDVIASSSPEIISNTATSSVIIEQIETAVTEENQSEDSLSTEEELPIPTEEESTPEDPEVSEGE